MKFENGSLVLEGAPRWPLRAVRVLKFVRNQCTLGDTNGAEILAESVQVWALFENVACSVSMERYYRVEDTW